MYKSDINKLLQFALSVEGHLSNTTLNIDYLKELKSKIKTERTFFKNLLIKLILFASPFCKKFEFNFEFDTKEFFDRKPDKIRNDLIDCISSFIFVIFYKISEISIFMTFPKYQNGIIMDLYRFPSIDKILRKKNYEKKKRWKKKELSKK